MVVLFSKFKYFKTIVNFKKILQYYNLWTIFYNSYPSKSNIFNIGNKYYHMKLVLFVSLLEKKTLNKK